MGAQSRFCSHCLPGSAGSGTGQGCFPAALVPFLQVAASHLSAPPRGPGRYYYQPLGAEPCVHGALIPGPPLDKSPRRLRANAREGAQWSPAQQPGSAAQRPPQTQRTWGRKVGRTTYGEGWARGSRACGLAGHVRVVHCCTGPGRGRGRHRGPRCTLAPCAPTRRAGQLCRLQSAPRGGKASLLPAPQPLPGRGQRRRAGRGEWSLRGRPAALPPTEPSRERLRRR